DAHLTPPFLDTVAPELVDAAVEAVLTTGPRGVAEHHALELLASGGIDPDVRIRGYERLLEGALTPATRSEAAYRARGERRTEKLRQLAEAFAWGIRAGRALTGRLFKVEMTTGQGLGYTRLEESRVFVSPLPILRLAPHGRAIVE